MARNDGPADRCKCRRARYWRDKRYRRHAGSVAAQSLPEPDPRDQRREQNSIPPIRSAHCLLKRPTGRSCWANERPVVIVDVEATPPRMKPPRMNVVRWPLVSSPEFATYGSAGKVIIGYPGYFPGKNYLGECGAIAVLLSLHEIFHPGFRRVSGIIVLVVATLLILWSNSKTALGLAFIAPLLAGFTLLISKIKRTQHVGDQRPDGGPLDHHPWRQMGGDLNRRRSAVSAPPADRGEEVLALRLVRPSPSPVRSRATAAADRGGAAARGHRAP